MTAAATFAAWTAACIASGHGGGDNLLRLLDEKFVIGEPRALGNGALVGRMHKFTRAGLTDIGGYKIGADGAVIEQPLQVLRELAAPLVAEDVQ